MEQILCEYCGKTFDTKLLIKAHMRNDGCIDNAIKNGTLFLGVVMFVVLNH